MLNIIICELKKFKRIWFPLIIGIFLLINVSTLPLSSSAMNSADNLFTWVNLPMFSYGFLAAINILTAYVFIWEFKNNTMSIMVTYKYERWKIYLIKIITIMIVSLILYITEFFMLTLYAFICFKDTLSSVVIIKHLLITCKAFFFQMLMISVTASIALVSKKLGTIIIYIGLQLAASMIFLNEPSVRAFIPFPLPVVPNLMLISDEYSIIKGISIMPSAFIIAVIMFIGGILFGCYYINRMEIE